MGDFWAGWTVGGGLFGFIGVVCGAGVAFILCHRFPLDALSGDKPGQWKDFNSVDFYVWKYGEANRNLIEDSLRFLDARIADGSWGEIEFSKDDWVRDIVFQAAGVRDPGDIRPIPLAPQDVVEPNGPFMFCWGKLRRYTYHRAIVVDVDPLVLLSSDGRCLWEGVIDPRSVVRVSRLDQKTYEAALQRKRVGPDQT